MMIYSKKAIQFIGGMVDKMVEENKMIAKDSLAVQNGIITKMVESISRLADAIATQNEVQQKLLDKLAQYFDNEMRLEDKAKADRDGDKPPTKYDSLF
jgi:hypothetical protein